jgi:hypothetical protein
MRTVASQIRFTLYSQSFDTTSNVANPSIFAWFLGQEEGGQYTRQGPSTLQVMQIRVSLQAGYLVDKGTTRQHLKWLQGVSRDLVPRESVKPWASTTLADRYDSATPQVAPGSL